MYVFYRFFDVLLWFESTRTLWDDVHSEFKEIRETLELLGVQVRGEGCNIVTDHLRDFFSCCLPLHRLAILRLADGSDHCLTKSNRHV